MRIKGLILLNYRVYNKWTNLTRISIKSIKSIVEFNKSLCWNYKSLVEVYIRIVKVCVSMMKVFIGIVEVCVRIREVCVGMLKRSERASLCYILILACIRFQNYENFLKKSSFFQSKSHFFAHFL